MKRLTPVRHVAEPAKSSHVSDRILAVDERGRSCVLALPVKLHKVREQDRLHKLAVQLRDAVHLAATYNRNNEPESFDETRLE